MNLSTPKEDIWAILASLMGPRVVIAVATSYLRGKVNPEIWNQTREERSACIYLVGFFLAQGRNKTCCVENRG